MICSIRIEVELKKPRPNYNLSLSRKGATPIEYNIMLMNILSKEDAHPVLSSFYDEIVNQTLSTVQTRSQTPGLPGPYSPPSTGLFHNSFLQRTIRDLNMNHTPTADATNISFPPRTNL